MDVKYMDTRDMDKSTWTPIMWTQARGHQEQTDTKRWESTACSFLQHPGRARSHPPF